MTGLLLDTHVVLWWLIAPENIPAGVLAELATAPLFVSAVSGYELALKVNLGKLPEALPVLPLLVSTLRQQDVAVLDLSAEDMLAAGSLPLHHRDPFDRMIVATALRRGLVVVTADPAIGKFGVSTRW